MMLDLLRKIAALVVAVGLCFASPAFAFDGEFYTDCEKYPGSVGCMPVGDVPAQETVPSQTRNLELQRGPVFAGGGCPANVHSSIAGRSLLLVNMAQACNWIDFYMRPLVLLLATISAVFIVVPRD